MEFAPSKHEPCVRCLQLGTGLCQPDFVGARVDGEEETHAAVTTMARVAIVPASRGRRVTCFGVIVIGPPSNFGRSLSAPMCFAACRISSLISTRQVLTSP